ncbi:cell wall-associated NlpC family hydrolase [Actinocorallia herbida]|uniref:Cell wall-associated NlpC family hydrolase n=1 Tax=Actinocorallia herbida TaxID=58109 RepID=A0A3N1CND8_9ACTN|nr:C40 family peptidase [Actinocorallia herbida]ROO82840.1 cell wall-associated NlpC family hydrolase [Actinocorallia herbida]
MKGARFTLATAVLAGATTPLLLAPPAQAAPVVPAPRPAADTLQKRLDGLEDHVAQLDKELAADQKAVLAAQNIALAATTEADLRRAEHQDLADQVAAVPPPVNLLQAAFLRITGSPADELTARRDAAARVADDASDAEGAARARLQETVHRVAETRGERATTTARITTVKADLRDAYTYQGVTVWGGGTAAVATRHALDQLGDPYVWAAAGPDSFDCSGLVVWAYAQAGKPGLPHFTGALWDQGTKITKDRLRPGDLVFFNPSRSHVGIYIGEGKFVQAPSTGDVVKITPLADRSDFNGAVRV